MSTTPPLIVVVADRSAVLPETLAARARSVLVVADAETPATLEQELAREPADVLWLPAWVRVDERVLGVVEDFRAHPGVAGPRAARVRLRLRVAGAEVALPAPRIVLSGPGGAVLAGERPAARPGVRVETLSEPWHVEPPELLADHLGAVNAQTSVAARLRAAHGAVASWRDLSTRPAGFAARALLAAHGSRRVALPRVVIEAYREVLIAAKLWERAQGRSAVA